MCGIVGTLFDSKETHKRASFSLQPAVDALHHRGPDGHGTWRNQTGHCHLGHTRLAIQDISDAAHQPFVRDDLILVFNGEIYNFLELRQELQACGYKFYSSSDTEVIIAAYRKWGQQCFSRFNGMWAIALWDESRKTLLLCRDRFGVKPLYYGKHNGMFAFASEHVCFSKLPDFPLILDENYLKLYQSFSTTCEALKQTMLQKVYKFPPGYILRVDEKLQYDWHRWWDIESDQPGFPQKDTDILEQFSALLMDAVKLRQRSDAKIGVTLSGGLDSGSIASLMNQTRRFDAYTCVFDSGPNELEAARSIMASYPGRHKEVRCPQPNLGEILTATLALGDVCEDSFVGLDKTYQVMNADGIKVSVEGHGGDENLAGYHFYLRCYLMDRLKQLSKPQSWINEIAVCLKTFNMEQDDWLFETLILARQGDGHIRRELGGRIKTLGRLVGEDAFCTHHTEQPFFLRDKLNSDFTQGILPSILRDFDRMSMRHGIEVRSPMLDYRFVQFCRQLPTERLIKDGYSKQILRESMSQLPSAIRMCNQKFGFTSPFRTWLKNTPEQHWLNLIDIVSESNQTIFVQHNIKQRLVDHAQGKLMHEVNKTWGVLSAGLLMDSWQYNRSPHDLSRRLLS